MIAKALRARALLPALVVLNGWLLFGPASRARAQDAATPPLRPAAPDSLSATRAASDSAAATPAPGTAPDSTATSPPQHRVSSTFRYVPEDRDRFEVGIGPVQGFFRILGSVAYRRWVGQGPVFEQNMMLEVSGSAKKQLTEGAFGFYLFMRPSLTYRDSWRIRPLIEFGPAAHAVVQVASLEGLGRTLYRSEVYVKTHGYVGAEALVSRRIGLLIRGRVSVPSHRPMDYAQAAIFLR